MALEDAAGYLALPRHWGLTTPKGSVGGAHAGYQVYECANGRVAVAALEPHFAAKLLQVAGLKPDTTARNPMLQAVTKTQLASFFATLKRKQIDALALAHDLPLLTMSV